MTSLVIRPIRNTDVDRLGDLHGEVFPSSSLAKLGTDVVARYYQWQLDDEEVDGIVAEAEGEVLGWLIGGHFRGSTVGFVKRHWLLLLVRALRHPCLLLQGGGRRAVAVGVRLLVSRSSHRDVERPDRVPTRSYGVLAVGVAPRARRSNVGTSLLIAAEEAATHRGDERLHLTLNPTNEPAMAFYRGLGWHRLGLPGDTETAWLMGKDLPDA